jgi:hypothetical protein
VCDGTVSRTSLTHQLAGHSVMAMNAAMIAYIGIIRAATAPILSWLVRRILFASWAYSLFVIVLNQTSADEFDDYKKQRNEEGS